MLQLDSYTIAFILALFTLANHCAASPVPDDLAANIITARGVQKCAYRIKSDRDFGQPPSKFREDSTVKTFAACIGLCDNDRHCVAARFKPFADQGFENPVCLLSDQIGFARETTTPTNGSFVAQLVPNTCEKPVAVPTPVACAPAILTAPKSGCKYNLTCGEMLDPMTSAAIAFVKTPEDCARETFKLSDGTGYTFFQGGRCFISISNSFQQVATFPRIRTATAQIIENSCNKSVAISNPSTRLVGGSATSM